MKPARSDVEAPGVPQLVEVSSGSHDRSNPAASKEGQHKGKHSVSYWQLYRFADGLDKLLVVVGTIASLGAGAALPLFAILFGDFSNAFGQYIPSCFGPPPPGFLTSEQFQANVNGIALKFLYVAIGGGVAAALQQFCWSYTCTRQANRMRYTFLLAVLRQDIAFFDTEASTGGLLQGLNEDALAVQEAISDKVGLFLQNMSTFITGYIIAFWRGWDMTLVMLGCLPFLAAAGGVMARVQKSFANKTAVAYAEAGMVVQQQLSQIRTVTAYNGQDRAVAEYDSRLKMPLKVGEHASLIQGVSLGSMQFTMFCSYAIALFYGAWRISVGAYTGGGVLNVLFCAIIGSFSVGMAAPNLQYFTKGTAAASRMSGIILRQPAIDASSPAGEAPQELVGHVELRSVCFAYPARPDVQVFQDFNLEVPAGKTVALVGSSGSGKSTVIGLIERYYDPSSGTVLLDGVDLRQYNLAWLRQHIGLVSQEPTLFANSIYENIAIGREGATLQEVEEAARAANAWTFINSMPDRFDTKVGERGVQLSGGQKQRIAIARAILKNPKVLLLDEATSALDAGSERIVQDALDRLVVGRTTLVVAHRLSTIQGADVIAVVRQGRVVEQGTHQQLLQDPTGAYTTLVKLQMQQEQQTAAPASGQAAAPGPGPAPPSGGLQFAGSCELAGSAGFEGPQAADGKLSVQASLELEAAEVAAAVGSTDKGPALQVVTVEDPLHPTAAAAPSPASPPPPPPLEISQLPVLAHAAQAAPLTPSRTSSQAAASSPVVKSTLGRLVSTWHRLLHKPGATKGRPSSSGSTGAGPGLADQPNTANPDNPDSNGAAESAESGESGAVEQVPWRRLAALNKPEWGFGTLGAGASVVVGGVQPAFGFVFSSMIAIFYLTDMKQLRTEAGKYSAYFVVLAVGMLSFVALQQYCFGVMGQRLARRMRVLLFKSMLRQDIGWFDLDANSSGKLASYLATDASYIRGAVGDVAGAVCQNLSTVAVGYVIAMIHDWRMALLVTGVAPFVAASGMLRMKFHIVASAASDKLYSEANHMVSEAVVSIRVIQAYRLEPYVSRLYHRQLQGTDRQALRGALGGGAGMGYAMFVMFAMYGLVTWFGGLEVTSCRATFKEFFTAFMCVIFVAMGMAQAQVGFPDLARAKGAVGRVFRIVDRQPPIDSASPSGLAPPGGCKGQLQLDHVVFAYPSRPHVPVFRDFCLTVPAGQTVAVVGESGSGKSTVVALLQRFYDPLSGTVLLDGVDLRQYNLAWLRNQMALVSQEPLLFATTILDNIRYGAPWATQQEVTAAAAAANALDFVKELPEGFNTQVGEQGVQLSGGQKQRVAIARAILKDPKVLLLDEATSALDAASEHLVQDALDKVMVGRTSVVVAHRLSTIQGADSIAVVHQGVLLEQGTHEELLVVPGGGYARLVAAQMKNAARDGGK